ncbi:hypothetical protein [Aureibacter tunicatorum]|uniref:Transmembrane protein n=1 Tax=Aureibacter tunicatorum TaxID=866807 RepID=A0AAE3XNP3_9BACT|nr:hypothetical protein [Aureibacter tunicatorum]MDR6239303.1 hypothetical protein [Aureibacter tunicatorum]
MLWNQNIEHEKTINKLNKNNQLKEEDLKAKVNKVKALQFRNYRLFSMLAILIGCGIGYFWTNATAKKRLNQQKEISDHQLFSVANSEYALDWSEMKNGGNNMMTAQIIKNSPESIKIKSTFMSKIFSWAFILLGLNEFTFKVYTFILKFGIEALSILKSLELFFNMGGIFIIIGIGLRIFLSSSGIFRLDKQVLIDSKIIPFDQFLALQFITKQVHFRREHSQTFPCYELNLVLKDGKRINLLNHGVLKSIKNDAYLLKNELNIPILILENKY